MRKKEIVLILRDIMQYRSGTGKYDFSHLPDYQRDNVCFDAWQAIETRIRNCLRENKIKF